MKLHLTDNQTATPQRQPHISAPLRSRQVEGKPAFLENMPWDVVTLIFEELDTKSLLAATVSDARAHPLPAPLDRVAPRICRHRYERFLGQVTYPHRQTSETTRKNTWSVLLAEQETLKGSDPLIGIEASQTPNSGQIFLTLAKLLPLWETANPAALSSFWSRFHKSKNSTSLLANNGERALLYLGLIEATQLRPAAHPFYCAVALSQMRRGAEALEAFEQALSVARREDTSYFRFFTHGPSTYGHFSRPAIIFSMWFIGLWLGLPSLTARAKRDGCLHPYDQAIGREMLGRLQR